MTLAWAIFGAKVFRIIVVSFPLASDSAASRLSMVDLICKEN